MAPQMIPYRHHKIFEEAVFMSTVITENALFDIKWIKNTHTSTIIYQCLSLKCSCIIVSMQKNSGSQTSLNPSFIVIFFFMAPLRAYCQLMFGHLRLCSGLRSVFPWALFTVTNLSIACSHRRYFWLLFTLQDLLARKRVALLRQTATVGSLSCGITAFCRVWMRWFKYLLLISFDCDMFENVP